MSNNHFQFTAAEINNFILTKLTEVLITDKYAELKYLLDELHDKPLPSAIYIAFSKAARMFGKEAIHYSTAQFEQADSIRKNWHPPASIDKATRLLILLQIPLLPVESYITTLENLFDTGDAGEQTALYASLPVLSYPQQLIRRCEEGIRTNMSDVFESVANNNPFPADYLSEDAFNQMVLKCMFIGKPLYKIINLSHRLNPSLGLMAQDYAHERWAANRKVNPELWQLIEPYLELNNLKDIERMIWTGDDLERKATALLCYHSKLKEAQDFFESSKFKMEVESGEFNWQNLGVEVWQNQHFTSS